MKRHFWFSLPVAILFVSVFHEVLFTSNQFCFRDAGFFYRPLFQMMQSELNAGRLPLWDSYDSLGQPLAGNPTSAVFYPMKAVFFLTALFPGSFDLCYKFYILSHLLIAFWGMNRLMRSWGVGASGAQFAAIVYAFSPTVCFQWCNVIFLVGAAWLPWAINAGEKVLRGGSIRPVALLGLLLALMVLGGDPQTAYIAGLLLFGLWLVRLRENRPAASDLVPGRTDSISPGGKQRRLEPVQGKNRRKVAPTPSASQVSQPPLGEPQRSWSKKLLYSGLIHLLAAALLGGLLSAVVVLPAFELSKQSDRTIKTGPDSFWEIPGFLADKTVYSDWPAARQSGQSRLGFAMESIFWPKLRAGGHRWNQYDISVPPWRFAEFLWPTLGGNDFATSSWAAVLPNERFWIPTISFGVVPLILVLTQLRLRRRRKGEQLASVLWASWALLLSLGLILGGFGLAWLWRAIFWTLGFPDDLTFIDGDPFGGLYWLFSATLPLFSSFRFPVKYMVVVVLAAAVLAGFGFDRLRLGAAPSEQDGNPEAGESTLRSAAVRLSRRVILLSLGVLALFWMSELLGLSIPAMVNRKNALFSPGRAQLLISAALLQPVALLSVFLLLLRLKNGLAASFGALSLLCADLAFTLSGTVACLPQSAFCDPPELARTIRAGSEGIAPPRFYPYPLEDRALGSIVSRPRAVIASDWQRKKLWPKHSEPYGIGVFQMAGTLLPAPTFSVGCYMANQYVNDTPRRRIAEAMCAYMDIGYFLYPEGLEPYDATLLREEPFVPLTYESMAEPWPIGMALWKNQLPHDRVRILRPTEPDAAADTMERMLAAIRVPKRNRPGESVRLTQYRMSYLTFQVRLAEEGTVLVADQIWPGWTATATALDEQGAVRSDIEPITLEIRPDEALQTLRTVTLPAGFWQVEMVYRAPPLYRGLILSSLGILLFAAVFIAGGRRPPTSGFFRFHQE